MNDQPLVSVVLACYNHDKFVEDSIQSVIEQTYENIELIIIDDGSSDKSVAKIQKMINKCEERFTRFEFRYRPNKGLSATLNEALEWCQGEFFSPIASDDMFLPTKISNQINFLHNNPKCVGVFGGVELINDSNESIEKIVLNETKKYNFKKIILHQHVIQAPTQMLRIEALRKVGCYKADLIIEDWYMWLKLSQEGELVCLTEIFAKYRSHNDNTVKQLEKMHKGRFQVLEYFNESKYYNEAIYNVKLLNEFESYKANNSVLGFIKLILNHPFLSLNKLIKKLCK